MSCGNVLRDLYQGLATEDSARRLIPGIAERWEVSADGRTWTFHLRQGLRWSNGEPLDAPQAVASFRRVFAPKTAAPFAELFDALRLLNDQATIPLYLYTSKHLVGPEAPGFEANPLDCHASRWLRWRD